MQLAARRRGDHQPEKHTRPCTLHCVAGKVLSGPGQGVFVIVDHGVFVIVDQWTTLVGPWLRVALLPLSKKNCSTCDRSCFLGPQTAGGILPLWRAWWSHLMWGASFLPSTPLKLVCGVLHCLVMPRRGWSPRPIASPSTAGCGLIFVDPTFDVNSFKVGVWGPRWLRLPRPFRCGNPSGGKTGQPGARDPPHC